MYDKFRGQILSSFLKTHGVIIGVGGAIIAILSPMIINLSLSISWVIFIVFFALIFIGTFLHAAHTSYNLSKKPLPEVILGRQSSGVAGEVGVAEEENPMLICLLKPSELFSHDSLVSFYYIGDEGFEELIGFGYVIHIQEDLKIQVLLTNFIESHKNIVEEIMADKRSTLKKIRVKPFIPKSHLELYNF